MSFIFKLPDVGEGINEGEVVSWLVGEGDNIKEDQPLLELQNDKLLQEIPSPVSGKIVRILVPAGTVATVGDVLVEIEQENDLQLELNKVEESTVAFDAEPNLNKDSFDQVRFPNNSIANRILAMPSIRQYAREHQVDLTSIVATGRHGHITRLDVEKAIQSNATKQPELVLSNKEKEIASETVSETANKTANKTKNTFDLHAAESKSSNSQEMNNQESEMNELREHFSITRKAISKAMMTSQSHTATVAVLDEVEVSKLMAHRTRFQSVAQQKGTKLTYLPYVVKALIAIARKYPILNAMVDEQKEEIVYKKQYNIGIAVDTDQGLYVPNIKNADTKGIFTIANEISTLSLAAKEGRLTGNDMRQGTMTITNIGSVGGLWFTPIINYPEVIILGLGRIERKPIVLDDGTVGVGHMLALSLCFDHRIIDGKLAQLAMNELKRLLADPELLLMEG